MEAWVAVTCSVQVTTLGTQKDTITCTHGLSHTHPRTHTLFNESCLGERKKKRVLVPYHICTVLECSISLYYVAVVLRSSLGKDQKVGGCLCMTAEWRAVSYGKAESHYLVS